MILILTLRMLRKLRKIWYYKGMQKGYELGFQSKKIQEGAVPDTSIADELNEILNKEGF